MKLGTTHGTGLVLGRTGVLIRGASGAGKSLLALETLARWSAGGHRALLVSDDQVELFGVGAGLEMAAPATIAGLIELRGRGIVSRPWCARAPLHLVIDLVDALERMPEETAFETEIAGVALPRAPIPRRGVVDPSHQGLLLDEALAQISTSGSAMRQKTT
ncbi:hypothetical protein EMQ25_13295 [Arsenicitalea aurantiaca]|uniref:HPr kinase/phosphorylase C-terminal domain-containing protein n=1 Tax=Arsenicitalea aurantiaca TaxID=1783274 RepID=A0A433X8A4_9HYPH|nr:hypothetical protein [Arsenicitalea aurantiaca]RUT30283.1 hypothetical protein EMQ25_13295 [Arsenicitalea aurantiaca]